MVTEESGKKYQVGGWAGVGSLTLEKTPKKNTFSASGETSFHLREKYTLQEYVTEERLEVPVEFDEGINNLLKKIEVVANSSSKAKWKMYVAGKKTEKD